MHAKITHPEGFFCAPQGHTVFRFLPGQIVSDHVAMLAINAGRAVEIPSPVVERKITLPDQAKGNKGAEMRAAAAPVALTPQDELALAHAALAKSRTPAAMQEARAKVEDAKAKLHEARSDKPATPGKPTDTTAPAAEIPAAPVTPDKPATPRKPKA